tara:strand:+ start:9595 stop:9936 length:342 start_codon:yes stop_codon:yes gene_type:complete
MTDTSGFQIRLDHINLPARKPEWLAEWYAETFGFQAQNGFVLGAGAVIVFEIGEPLIRPGRVQFGFRCTSKAQVVDWADKLDVVLENESVYCGFKATDPEGYVFEVYWESTPE